MEYIYTADTNAFIEALAAELQSMDGISEPEWAAYVKTSHGKQRPPAQDNWWYLRSAAVLRKVALRGPIGTEKLRTLYGTRKNRGMAPEIFAKGSGSVLRKALQQLEAEGLIAKYDGPRKGRIVTPKGISLMTKVAKQVEA